MKSLTSVRGLFVVAGLYDGILGAAFLLMGPALFDHFKIAPPNHFGYVEFPAGLLVVFALMFFAVAARPRANRNLIPYGILLKVCYCGTVIFNWVQTDVPWIWKPFAVADFVFMILFVWAWMAIGRAGAQSS
jgi:hypothetical protein